MTSEPEDPDRGGQPPGEGEPPAAPPDSTPGEGEASPGLLAARRPPRPVAPQRRPLNGEVLTPLSTRPPPDFEPADDQSMLRNPYILAGLAVAGAIVLAVLFVLLFGGGGSAGDSGGVAIDSLTPLPGAGVAARSIATATVREGPSAEFPEIGTLRSGQDVDVVGRNNEATWFQIVFPPRSTGKGWVPGSALRVPDASISGIPVVASTPIPRPTVILPTPTPEPTETPSPTPTVTGTATPAGGPDLQASIVAGTCALGQRLVVSVRNLGPAPLTSRAITVLVTAEGAQRAIATQTVNLGVGETVDIDTTYVVQERVVALVDPLGTLRDPNASNNRVDCVVSGGTTATPTPTQRIATPPPFATP